MADEHPGVFSWMTETWQRQSHVGLSLEERAHGAKYTVRADSALQLRCMQLKIFVHALSKAESQAERNNKWNVCLKQNLVWQQMMTSIDSRLWAQIYFVIRTLPNIAKSLPEKSSLTYENISEIGCLSAVLFPSGLHRMKSNVAEFERTKNHTVQLGPQRRTEFSLVISFH